MKLLVSTPAYDPLVCIETYAAAMSLDTLGMEVGCFTPTGYSIAEARTKAAHEALDRDADWLLFIDSDVVPPKDALRNLLSHNVDICFGYYNKGTNSEGRTCLCEVNRDNFDSFIHKDELREMRDSGEELIEVRGGGFGCVLVRTDVFRRLDEPWFEYVWSYSGRKLSEDYGFCVKCRDAGIRMYADTRVDCGHVKQVVL